MITAASPQFRGFLTDFNRTPQKKQQQKKKEDTKTFSHPPSVWGSGAAVRKTVIKSAADCCRGIGGTCSDMVIFLFYNVHFHSDCSLVVKAVCAGLYTYDTSRITLANVRV